ncbi:MAG: dihydrodipicolinate synthase family protein [Armatimonas sp.]
MTVSSRFTGLIAAPPTPFHADFSLNLDFVERQAEKLIADGVSGVFISGSTGEGASMDRGEREQLSVRWCEIARGTPLRVLAHVGCSAQPDAVALAKQAGALGVAAVAAYAPYYYRPQSVDTLLDFLVPVAAAAPDTPFFYYHIPIMTGVNLSMREFLEKAPARIPNLAGLKYTHNDLFEYGELVRDFGERYDLLWGLDEILIAARTLGAPGAVGSTYNLATPTYRKLLAAVDAGQQEEARALAHTVQAGVRSLITGGSVVPALKALLNLGPPRPPMQAISPEAAEALRERLTEIGYI